MRQIGVGFALCVLSASPLQSQQGVQPFGLSMGASKASIVASGVHLKATNNRFIFVADTAPKPHSEFERYYLLVTPKTGLCKVTGIGRTHADDAYGTSLKSAFEALQQALVSKYGEGTRVDFLRDGALWTGPQEWMMSLKTNERTLEEFWPADTGHRLSFEVESILLSAKGLSINSGYLTLGYEGGNFARCKAEMDQQNDSGL